VGTRDAGMGTRGAGAERGKEGTAPT